MQEEHSEPLPVPGEQGQPRAVLGHRCARKGGSCLVNLPLWPSRFSTTQKTLAWQCLQSCRLFPLDIGRKGTLGGGEGVVVF